MHEAGLIFTKINNMSNHDKKKRELYTEDAIAQFISLHNKEVGTVLTKICPVKKKNENIKLWYLNICNLKNGHGICKIFNGNSL